MLNRIGLSSDLESSRASGPQACQSTGLLACCNKYGLVSLISRLGITFSILAFSIHFRRVRDYGFGYAAILG